MLKIEYVVSKEDLIDFNMYHSMNSKTVQRSLLIQRFIFLPILLIMAIPYHRFTGVPLAFLLPFLGVAAILWYLFYPRSFQRTIKRNITRMVDEGDNAGITGKHTLEILPEVIIESNELGETKKKWNSVQKIVMTEKIILIYTSAMSAFIIPLRSFPNEFKALEFFNVAKQYQNNKENI
jgi:hypothetical protein